MADTRPTVLVMRPLTPDVEDRLRGEFNALLCRDGNGRAEEEVVKLLREVDAICPTVIDRIDARVLQHASSRLRMIANFGVGYDNVDVSKARELGIVVTNTPDVLTESTADLAMTLLLMSARRTGEGERLCRSGHWSGWQPLQLLGQDVTGKILGLVGFGRIAQAVAHRAFHGFGMRILLHNRSEVELPLLERYAARQCRELGELLESSDFVSLHCPTTPATRHMIDANALRRMRRSGILINTARGNIVEEPALVAALKNGMLAGAGLDVYEKEPEIDPGLLNLENVVLLPHLGSATLETRSAMGHRMVDNLVEFFAGKEPCDRVGVTW